MPNAELSVVTGAFSYTGKYITQRLLATGKLVKLGLVGEKRSLDERRIPSLG